MTDKPTLEELAERIQRDVKHYGGVMPERPALAWSGYLAALIEWGLLSPSDYDLLCALIPKLEDDPTIAILLGRENE